MEDSDSREAPVAQLGLWDAVSIIVGIVVGVSIFTVPADVFNNVSSPWLGLAVWVLGGLLSLVGAFCYAELATAYPRSGGDYVYLTRAYGRPVGFLFGWAQLTAIRAGNIGALSYIFAIYAVELWGLPAEHGVWFAAGGVAALSLNNLLGVRLEKAVQNILTLAKVIGLGGILAAGILWGSGGLPGGERAVEGPGFGLAMILVLYAYGGWNDAAFVAAEVRDERRNIPRALIFGICAITLLYLVINFAFLRGLGFDGVRASGAPAAELLESISGRWGARGISLLVMISALGAINGMIFTGSRVYATLGADHPLFAPLGRWYPPFHSPIWSILAQAAVALIYVLVVGSRQGHDLLDRLLETAGLGPLTWEDYRSGFDTLVAATAPVFWMFFLLTGVSLFVLRTKDRDLQRPFAVPFYPLTPAVFCLVCLYMLYSSVVYAGLLSLLGIAPLLLGVPLYLISGRMGR